MTPCLRPASRGYRPIWRSVAGSGGPRADSACGPTRRRLISQVSDDTSAAAAPPPRRAACDKRRRPAGQSERVAAAAECHVGDPGPDRPDRPVAAAARPLKDSRRSPRNVPIEIGPDRLSCVVAQGTPNWICFQFVKRDDDI